MRKYGILTLLALVLAATAAFVSWPCLVRCKTAPTLNKGNKWRIVYYEGGRYSDYDLTLSATIKGLASLGWIDESFLPKNFDKLSNRQVWDELSKCNNLKYLLFLSDGFYSSDWRSEARARNREALLKRLSGERDVDLVIAMGTWAGKDLANNLHKTPVLVMSTSDPVRAGIIKSPEDSGFDHVFARCDPKRFERQVRLFHRLFGFKKLGMVFEDSELGRLYSAWVDVKKVADERGFTVIPCYASEPDIPEDELIRQYKNCYTWLSSRVDAIWITGTSGNQPKHIPYYLPVFLASKLPTWSMSHDSSVISHGILMALSKSDFTAIGKFQAEVMAKIFNGEKPGKLNQTFEDMNTIAVNSKVAKIIQFEIPNSIIRIADPVYNEIESQ
ncbi:MAG: ABC transporter substrate binding protein [Pseudomonadota bacterium]